MCRIPMLTTRSSVRYYEEKKVIETYVILEGQFLEGDRCILR